MSIEAAQKSLAEEQRSDAIRQTIKWVVYSLLIVNWAYYIFDDWRAAQHTVVATDSLLGWMNSYATSLDELAWFGLLFLFEAETYWLSDDALTKGKRALFILLRVSCYGFLAHTIYAYVFDYFELLNVVTLPLTTTLCDLAGQDYAFLRNLEYSVVQSNNCAILATTGHLFQIGDALVISDAAGVSEATFLAAIDLEDAIVWLAVVIIIELVVLIQEKDISESVLITSLNYMTVALYGLLICNAAYWAWKGHWVYAWDEVLWIGGFAAIEMNLSEWRDEIDEATAVS